MRTSVAATDCPQETNTEHLPASHDYTIMQIYNQGAVIATMQKYSKSPS